MPIGLRKRRPKLGLESARADWLALAGLAAIVVAAVLLRFVALDVQPGGLYGDEAAEGLDALRILHQPGFRPDWLVWLTSDGGREALFAYVVAGAFQVFGEGTLVLRAVAAAFGVAGVLGIYWLARRFGSMAGLVAAAWAAGSLWLVCVSRDGMRNTIVPLFGALALIALLNWAARPDRGSAILAGVVGSVAALYTYQPLKMIPLLVIVWLLWLRANDRVRYDNMRPGFVWFGYSFLLSAAPMVMVVETETASYFGRLLQVSAINAGATADSSLPLHILRTLGMFGITGDGNGRHNVPGLPLLPLPLVPVAALGIIRLWRRRRDASHALILLALPLFLIPPLFGTEGYSPPFLRSLGLAAPLGVTIGLGAVELVEIVRSRRSAATARWAAALVAAVLALVTIWTGVVYFGRPVADRYDFYTYPVVALADAARAQPDSAVVVDDYSIYDIWFLDYHQMPAVFSPPGSRIPGAARYSQILALSKSDLAAAVGPDLAAGIQPIAWDPAGNPTVWAVRP